jgi:hypothetical protein
MKHSQNRNYHSGADGYPLSAHATARIYHIIRSAAVFSILLATGCAQPIELSSRWRECDITIGDIDSDWGTATMYVPKAKIAVTMINDEEYLYVRLASRDRSVQAQVMGMGLTLWFDPRGGKGKTLGIHFPLGKQDSDMPLMTGSRDNDPKKFEEMLRETMNELEILGPGKEEIRKMSTGTAEAQGMKVTVGMSKGNLIYELRIPLTQDDQHTIAVGINSSDADTIKAIGIGFETPEFDLTKVRKRTETEGEKPEGMPAEGGSGPPPGGMGRMPGGGMPGGGPPGGEKPERLKVWTVLKLALLPSTAE